MGHVYDIEDKIEDAALALLEAAGLDVQILIGERTEDLPANHVFVLCAGLEPEGKINFNYEALLVVGVVTSIEEDVASVRALHAERVLKVRNAIWCSDFHLLMSNADIQISGHRLGAVEREFNGRFFLTRHQIHLRFVTGLND